MTQPVLPCLDLAYSPGEAPGPFEPLGEQHWQRQLSLWLASLQAELPPALRATSYSLGLQFSDDARLAELNGSWRGKPEPTDVLAFAAQEQGSQAPPPPPPGTEAEPLELGDIVISLPTAQAQAQEQGHSLSYELGFLASHGLLHLLGWDHPDQDQLAAMLARQEELLAISAVT